MVSKIVDMITSSIKGAIYGQSWLDMYHLQSKKTYWVAFLITNSLYSDAPQFVKTNKNIYAHPACASICENLKGEWYNAYSNISQLLLHQYSCVSDSFIYFYLWFTPHWIIGKMQVNYMVKKEQIYKFIYLASISYIN